MLEIFIWYLFLGVVFNFIVDISTEYARSKGVRVPDQSNWTWGMRIFTCFIWPLGLISYLHGLKQSLKNKNKQK